eukprot:Pgem_evm1s302
MYFFRLLKKNYALLDAFGKSFPYEITVGLNGKVWINSISEEHLIVLVNAIIKSEFMDNEQCKAMVTQLVKTI